MSNTQHPGGDHDDPVLRGVAEYWDEIQGLASQQQRERLLGLLEGTAEPDPAEARMALEDELLDLLPPGHPLVRLLISRAMFRGTPQPAAGYRGAMPGRDEAAAATTMPVTIYLADERIAAQVEAAVEALLEAAGMRIDKRDDPVVGSWFRRMVARARDGMRSDAAQDVSLAAAHALDSRLVLAQDADVTVRLLQNLAPVLGALQPTKDAVIRAGALLVVKAEWAVSVFQLTAAQQTQLDHSPQLARSPFQIMAALSLTEKDRRGEDAGRAASSGPVVPHNVRDEALDVIKDALRWQLAEARWQAIEQILGAMDAALESGDPQAVSAATVELEMAGPLRITRIGGTPVVSPPPPVRDRLNRLVFSLGGTTPEPRPQAAEEPRTDDNGTHRS